MEPLVSHRVLNASDLIGLESNQFDKNEKTMKILAASLLITIVAFSGSGHAAGNCGPKQQLTEALATQFGETLFASGTTVDSAVKFFGNPATGTWSVMVVKPNGTGCVVAIGEGLEVGLPMDQVAEGASY